MEKLQDHESIVAKILEHEVTKVFGIAATIFTVVNYIIIPIRLQSQEIENIRTNHLHTIEMDMAELKALQSQETKENNSAHEKIVQELTKTATILDQHLKEPGR